MNQNAELVELVKRFSMYDTHFEILIDVERRLELMLDTHIVHKGVASHQFEPFEGETRRIFFA